MYYILILGATVCIGSIWILWSQPRWLFSIYTAIKPGAIFFIRTNERVVALTIDDGPHSANTTRILNVLKQYQAHATFFLISNKVKSAVNLTTEIVRQGHEIGNHLTEDEPSIQLPADEFKAKLLEAHRILSEFAPLNWLRPGSGWYSVKMLEIAHQHGYQIALGSVFPYDTHIKSVYFATKFILSNVRPGSIIVLHDGEERGQRTANTLARILPALKQQGYKVVGLSELMNARTVESSMSDK